MSKVLEVLARLEGKGTFDDCFPILESLSLTDEELRTVIDSKFNGDRKQQARAYSVYGERLATPELKSAVATLIRHDVSGPIDSYAHLC